MSTTNAPPTPPAGTTVGFGRAAAIVYGVVLHQLRTTGRIIALALLASTAIIAGFAIGRNAGGDTDVGAHMIGGLGLGVIAPVVSLVFGGAALGDLRDDKTLVYLWLRPMGRAPVVVGAAAAAFTLAAPVAIVPVTIGSALTGLGWTLIGTSIVALAVAVIAYVSIFTLFGVQLRHYIVWGLAYILIWEGFISAGGAGLAQFAIRKYTRSIVARLTDADLRLADFSAPVAIVVPLIVAAAALAIASWRLAHHDVD